MSDHGWRNVGLVCVCLVRAVAARGALPLSTDSTVSSHTPVRFLHDRFHLELSGQFAAAALPTRGNLPGSFGLASSGLSDRLGVTGYRGNSVPFQAGEFYMQAGSGEELGVRADRMEWEGEPLGFPPSGAHDPAMLPMTHDSAYLVPVPLFGYRSSELVLWRDPELPDSARATARYTNGPDGYSFTGGRFRSEIGAGFETDAQVFRIFSDGTQDSSRFDGHYLDLELRKQWRNTPLRLRFRQNRADRDLVFRWQVDPSRAAHNYYLTHVTLEAARTGEDSEWLLSYDLRVEDQQKRAVPTLGSYQYWFDRRHRLGVSRLSVGRMAIWGNAAGEYRESDAASGLPGAFMGDVGGGVRAQGSRAALLVTAGARFLQHQSALYRAALALRLELFRGHALLGYAGAAREEVPPLRLNLPVLSGAVYSESGNPDLPQAEHAALALVLLKDARRLSYNLSAVHGTSTNLPVWEPSGDTALPTQSYAPRATDRSGTTLSGRLRLSPWNFLELEGAWRHVFATASEQAAYSPEDSWFGALRLPIAQDRIHLRITPECVATGASSGTLATAWWSLSLGVKASLKQLTVFWYRDNALDESIVSGGAYPYYGAHSRFGFHWDFWN